MTTTTETRSAHFVVCPFCEFQHMISYEILREEFQPFSCECCSAPLEIRGEPTRGDDFDIIARPAATGSSAGLDRALRNALDDAREHFLDTSLAWLQLAQGGSIEAELRQENASKLAYLCGSAYDSSSTSWAWGALRIARRGMAKHEQFWAVYDHDKKFEAEAARLRKAGDILDSFLAGAPPAPSELMSLRRPFVRIDITTPSRWNRHVAWRLKGTSFILAAAFSPTSFYAGVELLTGYGKGLALCLGPVWLGFAVAPAEGDTQPGTDGEEEHG
ncbi:hypothetical protein [Sphingosinicella sp. BN140058]|uniref:hypothetical protein n=1 Tax=Sphingosinicella sp. BN140058 TaxID=1892855 RepID=UPI0010137815|nr:hypothetical protein [Sphingosinicella sp. BN140058]QAY80445.1 hypothetical protein ETR14_27790 [Sphingosinicella sp. BN140058]